MDYIYTTSQIIVYPPAPAGPTKELCEIGNDFDLPTVQDDFKLYLIFIITTGINNVSDTIADST